MITETTTTQAPAATDARERLLNLISGQLESVYAMREERINWFKEAAYLLRQVELWAVQHEPEGHLIFRDPADAITMDSI
ncbi:hypothetical protein [Rhizobium paknamense]|uniref:Uncharacterized protein n=1 Tax=Rhizobium paknamense TaxID=1206817 RepID=A0ABU0IAA5_9HYPH|nr:hypothetical protein [Rhizobium paknamense]MDQ0455159.1 hypothetical protein [Rhizobium paknamense]